MFNFRRKSSRISHLLFPALLVLLPAPSQAQNFPTKPIRFITPSVAGSAPDINARRLAQPLTVALGQPVIVENKPGGSGVIAAQEVARSAPDGHTLKYGYINDILLEFTANAQFAWSRNFVPVTRLHSTPYIIVVHPSVKAGSLKEMIAEAKAKPGSFTFASSGTGGGASIYGALVNNVTGIEMLEVPYKSLGAGITDLIAGRIVVAFDLFPVVSPHIKSGKLRALAVTQARRLSALPDIPTVAESGFPDIEMTLFGGILVRAGTPPPVVRQLHQHVAKIVNAPDYKALTLAGGSEPGGDSPEEFAAFLRAETDRLGKLIKATGIKIE
jgi:tripartite-type tricarboxylate transporter receptor subunit TctC